MLDYELPIYGFFEQRAVHRRLHDPALVPRELHEGNPNAGGCVPCGGDSEGNNKNIYTKAGSTQGAAYGVSNGTQTLFIEGQGNQELSWSTYQLELTITSITFKIKPAQGKVSSTSFGPIKSDVNFTIRHGARNPNMTVREKDEIYRTAAKFSNHSSAINTSQCLVQSIALV